MEEQKAFWIQGTPRAVIRFLESTKVGGLKTRCVFSHLLYRHSNGRLGHIIGPQGRCQDFLFLQVLS